MANLRTVGLALAGRGHRVVAALRDPARAGAWFGAIPVVAAPVSHGLPDDAIAESCTYADLLHNNGWASDDQLASLARAWRSLYDLVGADVVVMEFSPLALLALQGHRARSVVIGTGFYCPPDVTPLPDLYGGAVSYPDRLAATEARILERMNGVAHAQGASRLDHVAELFARADDNWLATFPELDHYGARPGAQYCGTMARLPGRAPQWPPGEGPRIFAYLRPYPMLRSVVRELRRLGAPTVIYLTGTEVEPLREAAPAHIRYETEPLDLPRVAAECDLAILYAPHDSTAAMLLGGKPILQLPQHLEQKLVARRTAELGAGIALETADQPRIREGLQALIDDDRYARAAQGFAARHADHDPDAAVAEIVARIEAIAEAG
jgi:UDP:flavonoid glycosyltransferase YjiC (YdhE family)